MFHFSEHSSIEAWFEDLAPFTAGLDAGLELAERMRLRVAGRPHTVREYYRDEHWLLQRPHFFRMAAGSASGN